MLVKIIMAKLNVFKNPFGLNKKISWTEIATKNSSGTAMTLDNYLLDMEKGSSWEKITTKSVTVFEDLEARKIGNIVNIRGIFRNIAGTVNFATLPSKYRTKQSQMLFSISHGVLQINSDGAMYIVDGNGTVGINVTYMLD